MSKEDVVLVLAVVLEQPRGCEFCHEGNLAVPTPSTNSIYVPIPLMYDILG